MDIRNIKVAINNASEFNKIQDILLKNGCRWIIDETYRKSFTPDAAIVVVDGYIEYCFSDGLYFEKHPNKEVMYTDIISEGHNFITGEYVLVRNLVSDTWELDIFGRFNNGYFYKYVCVGGRYEKAIPYLGNEHLHGRV